MKKYEMFVVAALLAFYSLASTRAVSIINVDGIINFGPTRLDSNHKPDANIYQPRIPIPKPILNKHNVLMNNDGVQLLRLGTKGVSSDEVVIEKKDQKSTSTDEDVSVGDAHEELFSNPRLIKDQANITEFVDRIKNQALKIFDDVAKKFSDEILLEKVYDLKKRYKKQFGSFENKTKHQAIRTTFGNKKVVLNTVDYSNKLLSRLVNRFNVDVKDIAPKNGANASTVFEKHKDNFKRKSQEIVCSTFGMCRTGNEFLDQASDLITAILEHDDKLVKSAFNVMAKTLKEDNYSRIMDKETVKCFTRLLSSMEEMTPFEQRVILITFKLVMDNRNQPLTVKDPSHPYVNTSLAIFEIMELLNQNIILDMDFVEKIKGDFKLWFDEDCLRHARSVKIIIDGTIDFGPNWNFSYKISKINETAPKSASNNVVMKTNKHEYNDDFKVPSHKSNINTDFGSYKETIGRARNIPADDVIDSIVDDRDLSSSDTEVVTVMYKKQVKKLSFLRTPRKIKDERNVVKFVDRVKTNSIKLFDEMTKKFDGKLLRKEIQDLKQRYARKIGAFQNNTMDHTIRTSSGNKKVVLNTINYSNKLLTRLANRFKIDTDNNKMPDGLLASLLFERKIEKFRKMAYEDACKTFGICRAGNEFIDNISEILKTIIDSEDLKLKIAMNAIAKALKKADFSRIMDTETAVAFRKGLSIVEEMNAFEQRVLVTMYKLMLDSRHEPMALTEKENPFVTSVMAMLDVMEDLNRNIDIDANDWKTFKNNTKLWFSEGKGDINDIMGNFVNVVQDKINKLNDTTASSIKSKLKLWIVNRTFRVNFGSQVQFYPFII